MHHLQLAASLCFNDTSILNMLCACSCVIMIYQKYCSNIMSPKSNITTQTCISTLTMEHNAFPSFTSTDLQNLYMYESTENKRLFQDLQKLFLMTVFIAVVFTSNFRFQCSMHLFQTYHRIILSEVIQYPVIELVEFRFSFFYRECN